MTHPQAVRARRAALVLSAIAVVFALVFGVLFRHFIALHGFTDPEPPMAWLIGSLAALLVAYVLRIGASLCELFWLERTFANLPEEMRRVGPVEKVDTILVFGLSFVPVLSWFWKLGLVHAITQGFERVRATIPFTAPIPRRMGIAAIMFGWVPGLNVYIAPFLWELFARKIDVICAQIAAAQTSTRS